MSLSINNYYQKYYNSYDLTSESTNTSDTVSTTSGTNSVSGADSASFSDIAKLFFSFDGSDDTSEDSYTDTGNYTPSMMRPAPPPLSNEQMKSLLEEIQSNISAVDSDTSASESQDSSTLTTLQDLLEGYDLSSADSDEIASLFQSVQSVPFSWSYTDTGTADSTQSGQAGGIPPMLQSMGGFPPPFAWGLGSSDEDTEDTDSSISDVQSTGLTTLEDGLTTEDIQSLLENLQYSLSLAGNDDEASEDTDNPLAAVKSLLSKTNFMTANSSELSSLFNNVLQALE